MSDQTLRQALEELCGLAEKAAEGQRARGLRPAPPFVDVSRVRELLAAHPEEPAPVLTVAAHWPERVPAAVQEMVRDRTRRTLEAAYPLLGALPQAPSEPEGASTRPKPLTAHESWHETHPGHPCEYDTCPRGQVLEIPEEFSEGTRPQPTPNALAHNHPPKCCCDLTDPPTAEGITWYGRTEDQHHSAYGVHRVTECGPGICAPSRTACPACSVDGSPASVRPLSQSPAEQSPAGGPTRERIAAYLRDTVQTLDKDEEWHLADGIEALFSGVQQWQSTDHQKGGSEE